MNKFALFPFPGVRGLIMFKYTRSFEMLFLRVGFGALFAFDAAGLSDAFAFFFSGERERDTGG